MTLNLFFRRRLILYFQTIFLFFFVAQSQELISTGSWHGTKDSNFQLFINRVNSAPAQDRTAIVDSFMLAVPSFPFIEDPVAHFIYRGNVTSVNVPGDANGWSSSGYPMIKLSTTDFWYTSQVFESDARLDYKFILNGSSWILDPRNPHIVSGGYGPNSELAMPQYVQPWEIQYRSAIPYGRTEAKTIYSNFRSVNYSVTIYLPPGYDAASESYPTVYFQDGSEYISLGKTVNVIDNLIDSLKIQPVIGVFVTPTNRNEEYAGTTRTQYQQFFAYELVHFIDSVYRTLTSPQYRAVMGDSYGGNISALISYNHPDLFGNCGLHSGAFQSNGYEAFNLIVNGVNKKDSIKYFSVWGTYESPLTQNMRSFRDSLINQGYDFTWQERHEGHSWGLWRATTDLILQSFFPLITDVKDGAELPQQIKLYQNYPNPFNPTTNLGFRIVDFGFVSLKIFDLLGREVTTLVNETKQPGEYKVRWNAEEVASGVYLYRLQSGSISVTKKLVMVR
ncbi:MAG: T9SS type A sorting domain-containing protein [Ignavibacteriales bacterium]|nr:T9SS type A sorting domain-containing protein [Ignavibacteriales bacterium]